MKKILTVYTGGTICSAPTCIGRALAPTLAKRALIANFAESDSPLAKRYGELFEDAQLPESDMTLSENMTPKKLARIMAHIKSFDTNCYSGIIVMHGTDTLAFSAAIFSVFFGNTDIPIMLVSGNRPPMDEKSNANANFRCAAELIQSGIAPNVYVPYRNSDGIMRVYLGSNIMQCGNFSEDFFSAAADKTFLCDGAIFDKCKAISEARAKTDIPIRLVEAAKRILPLSAYTGLDYSRLSLDGIDAVLHGTYHSGTVCVERMSANMAYSEYSILHLADRCNASGALLCVAPCELDDEQYSSAYDMASHGGTVVLNMTFETAYAKLLAGISLGFIGTKLGEFMRTEINNEFVK